MDRLEKAGGFVTPTVLDTDSEARYRRRLWGLRALSLATLASGLLYIAWRYAFTLNAAALWFAIPVVIAESYSLISTALFVLNVWRPARRAAPPPPEGVAAEVPTGEAPPGNVLTGAAPSGKVPAVDVYITAYNEPVALLRRTAEAAMRIRWPDLHVYLLDDGGCPEMEAMAREVGCGYITRGDVWAGKPRHAKAGNVNNALLETWGEYILILDCDQIPDPRIVERTIGYMADPRVAFVQTPQRFYNIPPGDPFGADASLFYGPIQQGKDGWNAAFFCGSNALLRREALMQLGLVDYAQEMEARLRRSLDDLQRRVRHHVARARDDTPAQHAALIALEEALGRARQALEQGRPLQTVGDMARRAVAAAQRDLRRDAVREDLDAIARELAAMGEDPAALEVGARLRERLPDLAAEMSEQAPPDTAASVLPDGSTADLDLARADEAIPVLGLPTFSITEDMAVAMRLHAMGWRSVYHPEILAHGLAPEDLGAALRQRLRWAQGTVQILLHEKPFAIKGLTLPQRLQYFTTMYSYLSGFFSLVYLLAPIVYLFSGISPVSTASFRFLWLLLPYLVLNRLLFRYVAWGIPVLRGEQYSVALFPLWIRAVVSVVAGTRPHFAVTPKERHTGNYLRLVWPQLAIACATAASLVYGVTALLLGWPRSLAATLFSVFWGVYNIAMLWAILRAAVYRPPEGWEARAPDGPF
jgi:cellulose synthase (UDP-forming)